MTLEVEAGVSGCGPCDNSDEVVMHAVIPLSECPHLSEVQNVPESGIDASALCSICNTDHEVWICLTCYEANCGRYVSGHAAAHASQSGHSMALSLSDLSVWCYSCEAYVHNERLIPAKNSAHYSKFGAPMEGSNQVSFE